MKFGIRKVNVKTRVKARTTGKLKREVKRTVNPLYGQKGMGLVNDPEKSLYNKVYRNTTISVDELLDSDNAENYNNDEIQYFTVNNGEKRDFTKLKKILILLLSISITAYGLSKFNIAFLALGILGLYKSIKYFKNKKEL